MSLTITPEVGLANGVVGTEASCAIGNICCVRHDLLRAYPHRPAIELDCQPVCGIDRPLIQGLYPDSRPGGKPVEPSAQGHTCFGNKVEIPSVLRSDCCPTFKPRRAALNTSIRSCEIYSGLSRTVQGCQRQKYECKNPYLQAPIHSLFSKYFQPRADVAQKNRTKKNAWV